MIPVRKTLIISLIILVLAFMLEPFYRDYLFHRSLNEIPSMQTKKRLYGFFKNTSLLATFIVSLSLILLFNLVNRMSCLYIWMSTSLVIYLSYLLKMGFSEARPYWVTTDIKSLDSCNASFGNPSGRCMVTSFVIFTLYLN